MMSCTYSDLFWYACSAHYCVIVYIILWKDNALALLCDLTRVVYEHAVGIVVANCVGGELRYAENDPRQ